MVAAERLWDSGTLLCGIRDGSRLPRYDPGVFDKSRIAEPAAFAPRFGLSRRDQFRGVPDSLADRAICRGTALDRRSGAANWSCRDCGDRLGCAGLSLDRAAREPFGAPQIDADAA